MITFELITALADAKPQSHLIARAACALLPDTALIAEMREQSTVADTRFGCAPFARITLLPDALWQDSLTEGLLTALRPLLAAPVSADVVLDVTDIDEVVLTQVLRFLFNQAHDLRDLQLKKTDGKSVRLRHVTALCHPQQRERLDALFQQQQAIARGMVAARRLADMPSDRCTPQYVVDEAQKLCAAFPALRCEVLDEKQIIEQGLGLLHAVGKGATCPPRLLAIHYNGIADGPVRCYVGKGITFDTGGLWLKEGAGMYTMKYDMCGAANVLGLMLSVAELGLPVRIMGVLALAENAIGPDAMQPGTVANACNGITVEINNTDAEGRLVLADAIAWASQRHPQARYIIDMATLTGAVVKALGYELSGLMTQDEALRQALTHAGKRSGDEVWSLPLDARLKKQTDSAIADLCNTPPNNAAISASAAWLLHHFCPPTIPWAHLDISGTALWRENGKSVASGRPIPLLVEHLLEDR
ncbi:MULTISPECIES: leucyl aminopeptidase family protein [Enterobacter]|jgi:leucyl aminopeptidase|uniref:leucyl aminopeptidase family protein n=1 Tax=Enterobacter TaxID=547 RepID=UPI000798DC90|nr:leucyl aminopeptidase family protein [Enterobacter ludwigii]ELK6199025.1 leucyl aminopeptidase family protein [Enterobacter ludwigii]ELQ7822813.1 leucyl aminopeptidase family protein [Enterobacter ludwigii]MBB2843050.1 leucyl aminopeptidase [Enterobacter ludwigii]MBK1517086.1 leucyl aminopeptidase family protein [Enterobacter ludwigii]MBX8878292.1 leucyl aminopeptidase family protein [Enterobacter ludwigii]